MRNLKIKVSKQQLVDSLTSHKQAYQTEYAEAKERFFKKLLKTLDKLVDSASSQDMTVEYDIRLEKPEDLTDKYDNAIAMLTMHTDDSIEITTEEYDIIINDKWPWAVSAKLLNSRYL